jgi:hypothetical protein
MRKTTVYLNDEEVEALRQLAAATGQSQAEVIRAAIRHAATQAPPRRFRSLGQGAGPDGTTPRWDSADLYAKRLSQPRTDAGSDANRG